MPPTAERWEQEMQRIVACIDVSNVEHAIQFASTDEAGSLIFAYALDLVKVHRPTINGMRENKSGSDYLTGYDFMRDQTQQTFVEYFNLTAPQLHYGQRPDAVFSIYAVDGDQNPMYIFVEIDGPDKSSELRSNAMKQWQAMDATALSRYYRDYPCIQVRMNLHTFFDHALETIEIPNKWTVRSHETYDVQEIVLCMHSFIRQQCQACVLIILNTVRMMLNEDNFFKENNTYSENTGNSVYDMCLYVGEMHIPFPPIVTLAGEQTTTYADFTGPVKHKKLYRNTQAKVFENSVFEAWTATTRNFVYSTDSVLVQCVAYERVNIGRVLAIIPNLAQEILTSMAQAPTTMPNAIVIGNSVPGTISSAYTLDQMPLNVKQVLDRLRQAVRGIWSTRSLLELMKMCAVQQAQVKEIVFQCFMNTRALRSDANLNLYPYRAFLPPLPRAKDWDFADDAVTTVNILLREFISEMENAIHASYEGMKWGNRGKKGSGLVLLSACTFLLRHRDPILYQRASSVRNLEDCDGSLRAALQAKLTLRNIQPSLQQYIETFNVPEMLQFLRTIGCYNIPQLLEYALRFCTNTEQGALELHFLNTHTLAVRNFPLAIQTEIHYMLRSVHTNPRISVTHRTTDAVSYKESFARGSWRAWIELLMASDWCKSNFPAIKFNDTLPLYNRMFLCLKGLFTFAQTMLETADPVPNADGFERVTTWIMQLLARVLYLMTKPYLLREHDTHIGVYATAPSDRFCRRNDTGNLFHAYTWPVRDSNYVSSPTQDPTQMSMDQEEQDMWKLLAALQSSVDKDSTDPKTWKVAYFGTQAQYDRVNHVNFKEKTCVLSCHETTNRKDNAISWGHAILVWFKWKCMLMKTIFIHTSKNIMMFSNYTFIQEQYNANSYNVLQPRGLRAIFLAKLYNVQNMYEERGDQSKLFEFMNMVHNSIPAVYKTVYKTSDEITSDEIDHFMLHDVLLYGEPVRALPEEEEDDTGAPALGARPAALPEEEEDDTGAPALGARPAAHAAVNSNVFTFTQIKLSDKKQEHLRTLGLILECIAVPPTLQLKPLHVTIPDDQIKACLSDVDRLKLFQEPLPKTTSFCLRCLIETEVVFYRCQDRAIWSKLNREFRGTPLPCDAGEYAWWRKAFEYEPLFKNGDLENLDDVTISVADAQYIPTENLAPDEKELIPWEDLMQDEHIMQLQTFIATSLSNESFALKVF